MDRPCRLLAEYPAWALCPPPGDWSFPSNHAAFAGALAVGVLLVAHRLRAWAAAVLALLAGLVTSASRMLTGAQFPYDIGAG